MSVEGYRPLPPEDDRVPVEKIVLAAGGALLLFTIAGLYAWQMVQAAGPTADIPPELGRDEIGSVIQRPFALEQNAAQLKEQQRRQLSGYGWVDHRRQLIHIPIDRAIDELVRKEGAP
jgi:hypothetical protein